MDRTTFEVGVAGGVGVCVMMGVGLGYVDLGVLAALDLVVGLLDITKWYEANQ